MILLQVYFGMAKSLKSPIGRVKQGASKRRNKFNTNHKYRLRDRVGVVGSKDNLKTALLNVDGLSDTSLADVQDFVANNSPDVVFLLETKRRMEELGTDITIDDYDHFEVKRSDVSKDKQGG